MMDIVNSISSFLIEIFPKLLAAVAFLLLGWLLGIVIGRVIKELMIKLKIDQRIFREKRVGFKPSNFFPTLFSWTVYLLFIWVAVDILGIQVLREAMQTIVMEFLPGMIKAVIIVVVGYIVGEYIKRQVELTKVEYSKMLGNIVFWLIIYISVATALPLIGINPTLLNNILLIIGIAIAIGLGLKDVVREISKKYIEKSKKG
ncbi:MAG: hypothetical protein QXX38_00375 [Candidatus Aenigmatarchaeota archaeon]